MASELDPSPPAGRGAFPPTRYSVVIAARSRDADIRSRAFESLIAAYWKPVYKYLRLKWHVPDEDAKDLTQEFFARAMTKGFFDSYDPTRARFRTFLRTCLDGFASNARKAERRLKRGGDAVMVPLDFETAEGELRQHEVPADADMDEYFHREWIRSLLTNAVDELRERYSTAGKHVQFRVFARYDLEAPERDERLTYKQVADECGVVVSDVTNYLAAARREFRTVLLDRLRAICASDDEYRAEVRHLLGVGPR
jgi:RNA polymerase sigma factor (sigma-70 family)